MTLDVVRFVEANPSGGTWSLGKEDQYSGSWRYYCQIDAGWQADAGEWLSPHLQRLAGVVNDQTELDVWFPRIRSNWIERSLSVEEIDLGFHAQTIWLDDEIVNRAARLAERAAQHGAC